MGFDSAPCFTDAVLGGCRWLQRQRSVQRIALFGTRADIELARRVAADAGLGFGIRFETISSWVQSTWKLLGDGRAIVDGALREILVRRVLRQSSGLSALTAGEVDSTVSVIAQGVLPAMLAAGVELGGGLGLSSRELDALGHARDYRNALEDEGLIDLSDAAVLVSSDERMECCVAVIGSFKTSAGQQHVLDQLASRCSLACFRYGYESPTPSPHRASELQQLLGRMYASGATPPVRPEGAVRFLLPSGDYASARLVAECIFDYLRDGAASGGGRTPVVVAAKDPMEMHRRLSPWLDRADPPVSCALAEVQAFEDTPFGRGFLALLDLATNGQCALQAASDFALSPLSGVSSFDASRLDACWRADRLADREHRDQLPGRAQPQLATAFRLLVGRRLRRRPGCSEVRRRAGCFGSHCTPSLYGCGVQQCRGVLLPLRRHRDRPASLHRRPPSRQGGLFGLLGRRRRRPCCGGDVPEAGERHGAVQLRNARSVRHEAHRPTRSRQSRIPSACWRRSSD